ncbi:MAG: FMN-binding protein [Firmicutes bacterium]|jgi:uncharacterized protein with FMN-binding domain|nr:FMN-binding protein [Bacillota bacterium]
MSRLQEAGRGCRIVQEGRQAAFCPLEVLRFCGLSLNMGRRRKILIALGAILAVFGAGFSVYMVAVGGKLREVREIQIADVDLTGVPDGVYDGSFSYLSSRIAVKVTIKNHRIYAITMTEPGKTKYGRLAEGVIPRILEAQTPNVDVVSGATTTSKAIQKAVENAIAAAMGH